MAFWVIVQIVATVALGAYQAVQAKKAKKRAKRQRRDANVRQLQIRDTNSGKPIPDCWGRTGSYAVPVKADITNNIAVPASLLTAGQTFGSLSFPKQSKKREQALCATYVLCNGRIMRMYDVWSNDESLRTSPMGRDARVEWKHGNLTSDVDADGSLVGGASSQASAAAVRFSSGLTVHFKNDDILASGTGKHKVTDRFTGKTFLAGFYWLDLDDPKFGSGPPPDLFSFFHGPSPRVINRTGDGTPQSPYVYGTAEGTDESANFGRVAASTLLGRLGLSDDDLRLSTFHDAQEKSGFTVLGPNEQQTSQRTARPPTASNPFGISTTWSARYGDLGVGGDVRPPNFSWAVIPNVDLLRYEVNGNLWTTENPYDNLDILMECCPGGILFRGMDGKYALSVPDSETAEADQAVRTVGPDVLIGRVDCVYPETDDAANELTVRYANIFKDLADDAVLVPDPVSDANARAMLLEQDGGVKLADAIDLEAVNNKYHAYSNGVNYLLMNRRESYVFTTTEWGALLEEGDVVLLDSPDDDLSAHCRLESKKSIPISGTDREEWRFEARRFVRTDYAFYAVGRDAIDFAAPAQPTLRKPRTLSSAYITGSGEAELSWTLEADASPDEAFIILEERRASDGIWRPLATLSVTEPPSYRYKLGFVDDAITWRATTQSIGGNRPMVEVAGETEVDWRQSPQLTVDSRITTLAAGTTVHPVALAPGQWVDEALGIEGDWAFDFEASRAYVKRPELFTAETVGRGGLLARDESVNLVRDATARAWTASPGIRLPDASLIHPPGFVNNIRLAQDDAADKTQRLAVTNTEGAEDSSVAFTGGKPSDADGVVGQTVENAGQWWKRGGGVFDDAEGAETGILFRATGVPAQKERGIRGGFIMQLPGGGPLGLSLPDSMTVQPNGQLAQVRLRRSDAAGSPNSPRRVTLWIQTTAADGTPNNDDFDSALEPELWLAFRVGANQMAIPLGDFTSADTDEPYSWQYASTHDAAVNAWLDAWNVASGGPAGGWLAGTNTAGVPVDFALVDRRRRVGGTSATAADVLNRWFRIDASQQADFSADLRGNVLMGLQATATSPVGVGVGNLATRMEQVGGIDIETPYAWQNAAFAFWLRQNFNASIPNARMVFVDARARSPNNPLNPWVAFNVAGGVDGLGREEIFLVTATSDPVALPPGANQWPYDSPQGGWTDGAAPTAALPWVHPARRRIQGAPAQGAVNPGSWGDWVLGSPYLGWGQDGSSRAELVAYASVSAGAAAPARPGASGSYNFQTQAFTPPTGWTALPPDQTESNKVFATFAFAAVTGTATTWRADAADWSNPILWDANSSFNFIYQRSVDQPATPAAGAGLRPIPAGWHDAVADVPDGDGQIWVSIGTGSPSATGMTWTWQAAIRAEGTPGEDGRPGFSGNTRTVLAVNIRRSPSGKSGSAAPTGERQYRWTHTGDTAGDVDWNDFLDSSSRLSLEVYILAPARRLLYANLEAATAGEEGRGDLIVMAFSDRADQGQAITQFADFAILETPTVGAEDSDGGAVVTFPSLQPIEAYGAAGTDGRPYWPASDDGQPGAGPRGGGVVTGDAGRIYCSVAPPSDEGASIVGYPEIVEWYRLSAAKPSPPATPTDATWRAQGSPPSGWATAAPDATMTQGTWKLTGSRQRLSDDTYRYSPYQVTSFQSRQSAAPTTPAAQTPPASPKGRKASVVASYRWTSGLRGETRVTVTARGVEPRYLRVSGGQVGFSRAGNVPGTATPQWTASYGWRSSAGFGTLASINGTVYFTNGQSLGYTAQGVARPRT